MNEQQWLTSTNPAEMYAFIKDRVTERQRKNFIAAVEYVWSDGRNDGVFSYEASRSSHEGMIECLRIHNITSDIPKWADLLREVIGNPFRLTVRHSGLWWMDYPIGKWAYKEKPPNSIEFDPAWLTWNNATIPNLVRAMMEEECDNESRWTVPVSSYTVASGNQVELHLCDEYCLQCKGTNVIPRAEPQWDMMPILGDALEAAGCTEAAILDHLRGNETCPHCGRLVFRCGPYGSIERQSTYCKHCNGTGKRPARHVRGCWVVELLMGGMQ